MEPQVDILAKIKSLVSNNTLYHVQCGDPEGYRAFLTKFPSHEIEKITLEDYCVGDNSAEKKTFCWYIAKGLQEAFGCSPSGLVMRYLRLSAGTKLLGGKGY